MTESTSAVEQAIAARIARVRAEEERKRTQRAEFAAARTAGVARRNAAKLRRLAAPPEGSATPADGAANTSPTEENLMPAAIRSVHCPACRCERVARLVATVVVTGARHDVLRCTSDDCGLQWLARANRPRPVPAAA